MTAGLWAGSTSLTADFATVIWRIQLLGFNTIRLPFSFQARGPAHPDCAILCEHPPHSTWRWAVRARRAAC